MKVLFLIDTLLGSGAERSLVEIAQNFKKFTPVFVNVYEGNMLRPELERAGIAVYSLNIKEKFGFSEAVKLLIPIYKKEKPDIIHSTLFKSDMVARRLKRIFPDIPLIGSFVNNTYTPLRYEDQPSFMKLKLRYFYEMDRYTARRVDFFISNSGTIAKSEGGALRVPKEKIKVIFRGRDPRKFERIKEDDVLRLKEDLKIKDRPVLLNVSRLIKRKAQKDILRSLLVVKQRFPKVILLLAGHGDQENELKKEVKNLDLSENVQFLGRRTDIPTLLAAADVFVYPSYAEGLPGALIEAMLAECIIVASDIGENLECIDRKSALIFPKGNIQLMAEKIVEALEKNVLYKKTYGAEARTQAVQKFEIGNISKQYEELYQQVLTS